MKQLSLLYLILAVIAVALIMLPRALADPEFKAKSHLSPDEAIADGTLELVTNGKFYVAREVPAGKTVLWSELRSRPTANSSQGHVPLAVDTTRSEMSETAVNRGSRVRICPADVVGEFVLHECGIGVEACIAILLVSDADREKARTSGELTIKLDSDCG